VAQKIAEAGYNFYFLANVDCVLFIGLHLKNGHEFMM
jgi:hypothetical protein